MNIYAKQINKKVHPSNKSNNIIMRNTKYFNIKHVNVNLVFISCINCSSSTYMSCIKILNHRYIV